MLQPNIHTCKNCYEQHQKADARKQKQQNNKNTKTNIHTST